MKPISEGKPARLAGYEMFFVRQKVVQRERVELSPSEFKDHQDIIVIGYAETEGELMQYHIFPRAVGEEKVESFRNTGCLVIEDFISMQSCSELKIPIQLLVLEPSSIFYYDTVYEQEKIPIAKTIENFFIDRRGQRDSIDDNTVRVTDPKLVEDV